MSDALEMHAKRQRDRAVCGSLIAKSRLIVDEQRDRKITQRPLTVVFSVLAGSTGCDVPASDPAATIRQSTELRRVAARLLQYDHLSLRAPAACFETTDAR
jgi:hypothetical protein